MEVRPTFQWGPCFSIFSFLCIVLCESLFVCLSVCYFCHCIVCPSSIYGFWLPFVIFKLVLMVSILFSGVGGCGEIPGQVKTKTMQLIFAASPLPLSTQHCGARAKQLIDPGAG